MLEADAKKRWCPFARVFASGDYLCSSNGVEITFLANPTTRDLTRCITTGCMAWEVEHAEGTQAGKWGHCNLMKRS